ncbi:MAG: flavin reductase [Bacteroidetes bacterium]|nr:flavin reductase [Bacteroidota bacterium]
MSMRKKPWNRTDQPVYSISSKIGDQHNMHIATYVTPISMQPKQYVVGIYEGTRTLELVEQQQVFVLQLLAAHQYNLVPLLGKQSGHQIDKIQRLQKRKLLDQWNDFYILKDALSVVLLQGQTPIQTNGDHRVYICDVLSWKNLNQGEVLTLDYLREKKVIRG